MDRQTQDKLAKVAALAMITGRTHYLGRINGKLYQTDRTDVLGAATELWQAAENGEIRLIRP